jgi:Holliday junction resolvase-like predicted endonuclease
METEGDETDMQQTARDHWSYSQLNQLLRICPLQFAFQRIHHLQPEFVTETLPFGSAIHRTAEYLWASKIDGKDVAADDLVELFAELWKRQVNDTPNLKFQKTDFDSLLTQGQEMIRVYRQSWPEEIEIEGLNVPFQVPLVDRNGELLEKPLVGEIDLLIRHGKRLCAVDLKTAAQRYSDSKLESDLQPTVYLYVLRMIQNHDAFFRYDVLVKNKTPALVQYPAERNQKDFFRLVDLYKAAQALIDSGNFIPNNGSNFCGGCGFQTACREWQFGSVNKPMLVPAAA